MKLDINYFQYLLLALFPIMSLYEFLPLINIGYFILLLLIIINIFSNKFNLKINLKILITMTTFMVINMIVGITKYIDLTNTINNTIGMLVFTIIAIFICVPNFINMDKLYRSCKLVAIVATIFLFYQFLAYHLLGRGIQGNIPFLTPNNTGFDSINYGRPTSFFYEPAHYALYIGPIFAISLIRRELLISLILILGLILSTSSTGIVIAISFPILVFFIGTKRFSMKNILIILAGSLILFFITSNYYDSLFEKFSINELKNNIRIFGTLDYFKYFSTNDWLFGIGINRLTEYLSLHGYLYSENYASSYIFSVFSFGIVGGIVWLMFSFSLYKSILKKYKIIYVAFIYMCLTDQVLFNSNLLYILMWIYAISSIKERKKII
ncbi:hypothetical protein [Peribacillus butanolivorans]